jgi:ATP-dependent helicase/nuclease subunit A
MAEQLRLDLAAPAAPPPPPERRDPTDPGASLWVAASAGTGKTTVLTNRMLRLMLEGTPPARILGITFTKAAAAEMAGRISGTLREWATIGEEKLRTSLHKLLGEARWPSEEEMALARRQFARVLDVPGGMKIQTIHAFCQSLLRRFPLEAGVAPHFEVLDERTAVELIEATRQAVLQQARAPGGDRLTAALGVAARHVAEGEFEELVGQIVAKRSRIEAALAAYGGTAGLIGTLRRRLALAPEDTPQSILEAGCRDAVIDLTMLREAAVMLGRGSNRDRDRGAALASWLAAPDMRMARFEDCRGVYFTEKKLRQQQCTGPFARAYPNLAAALDAEAERVVALIERTSAATVAEATEALLTLGEAVLARYRAEKAVRSQLDFDDLIQVTRDLLQRPGVAEWVLFKLDGGIDHILVDEAQDTNLDQWAVIEPLAAEFFSGEGVRPRDQARTIFAVGDPKQSIFMFQGADPEAFRLMRERFRLRVAAAGKQWDEVPLDRSFRSTPPVLAAVDAVFARPEAADGLGADGPVHHVPRRLGEAGLVELWPAATPRVVPLPAPWQPPVERQGGDSPRGRLALLIARRIARMIESREPLEAQGRPIRPGDIMVLVRRRNAFVDELVRALKQNDVAVAGVDRMLLTDQIAVMDLMALGRFLLLPDDDLNLAALLRSPLIDLDEDALFALAYRRERRLWPTLRARAAERPDFARAHEYLAALLARADAMPAYELYAHVLGALRGREAMLRRLGPEAADPIDEFMGLALAFERSHAPSLQRFLHWVETRAVEVKRELEQGSAAGEGQVRIMTVHGAKGLEAPIVFLPDTCEIPQHHARLLWHVEGDGPAMPLWVPRVEHHCALSQTVRIAAAAAEMEEHRRLLYVAMTRARDRLYVCGYRGRNKLRDGCWYDLVEQGLKDLGEGFEFDSRPDLGEEAGWIGPGRRHASVQAEPARTQPSAAPPAGVALPAWLRAPAPAEPEPPRPLAPSRPSGDEPPVRSPLGPDEGLRFRRGLVIHRLLQSLPDLPPERRRKAAADFLARPPHGLTAAQQEEMLEETLRVLAAPAFASLFGPGSRAEVPIVGEVRGADGRVQVLSGQIDRLVVAQDEILVLDYKTNRPPPATEAEVSPLYLRQMAAYRAALARIYPGRPIRCALLWTDGPRLMPLASHRLDAYQL